MPINPLTAEWVHRAFIDFTLAKARRFYSPMGNPLDGKGLKYLRFVYYCIMFVLTTRRAPVNSILSWLFRWPRSCKKAISTYHCWHLQTVFFLSVWRLQVELAKNNLCHSQLSYNLERNIVKWVTITAKQTERITQKNLSKIYHLIMSIFSLFHFVASMKPLALNRW